MLPVPSNPIAIWGAGGHGRVVADAIAAAASLPNAPCRYDLAGFLDDRPAADIAPPPPAPLLGGPEALDTLLARGVRHAIVAVGDCTARARIAELLTDRGFDLASVLHPAAVIAADARIGPGSFVAAGSVIATGARLGSNVIINTRTSVDHDCSIADHAHLCPGVTLGGAVRVGRACWVGIGSTIIENITLGDNAFIAAGSVVVADVPPAAHVRGVPARVYET